MNPFIILHHCPPQDKPGITPTGQCHLTGTSLNLLWQGPWIIRTILMFLWIWQGVHWHPVSLLIVPPVIVTAQNKKWLLQLLPTTFYHNNNIYIYIYIYIYILYIYIYIYIYVLLTISTSPTLCSLGHLLPPHPPVLDVTLLLLPLTGNI